MKAAAGVNHDTRSDWAIMSQPKKRLGFARQAVLIDFVFTSLQSISIRKAGRAVT